MSERREWESVPIDDAVKRLADAGLLTERQAEAWVYRELQAVPRQATADAMDISVNTLDKRLREARDKVEQAQATADVVESLRNPSLPSECASCGGTLGGRFSENDDGEPVCLECAGIE